MWMPRISPAEAGAAHPYQITMGWGTSLDELEAKKGVTEVTPNLPLRELLQILFYGNSALGNSCLTYRVDFAGCVGCAPCFCYCLFLQIRIAFRTAMIVTPITERLPHTEPCRVRPEQGTLLMPRAITMFCITIRFVAFAASMASHKFRWFICHQNNIRSFNRGIQPRPPMAMPTSARARTGASLMPSPTKASLLPCRFCLSSISSFSTFWSGKSCA